MAPTRTRRPTTRSRRRPRARFGREPGRTPVESTHRPFSDGRLGPALVAPDFSESSQVPGPPSGGGQPAHPDPSAQARPAAADVADRGCRDRRGPRRQRSVDPGDVAAPWRPRAALDHRRHPHRDRPGHGAVRHLPRADPARPDVTQPVARPGVRDGRTGRRAPLARLRDRLAAARPRRLHDRRLRARRREQRDRGVLDAHHDLPVRPDGNGQRRPLRGRRDQLDARRPSQALVRDVVRDPPLRLSRDRPRLPPPAVRRRPTSSTTRSRSPTGSPSTS